MRLSIRQYAEALLELEKGVVGSERVKEVSDLFFAWLLRRGEGKKIGKIVAEAERVIRERSGKAEVRITTAYEADTATQHALKAQAEKVFFGKEVTAAFEVDPSLMGGVKMRSEEALYDGSISSSMRSLRKTLMK